MMANIRLSADPKSYQLVTTKEVKKGEVVFTMPRMAYVSNVMHTESSKAGFAIDVVGRSILGSLRFPYNAENFNITWSSLVHTYKGTSPFRPLFAAMDVDFFPPHILVANEEIDLLKGTKEYEDLLNLRHGWYDVMKRTFWQGNRKSFPFVDYGLGKGHRVNSNNRGKCAPEDYLIMHTFMRNNAISVRHKGMRILPAFALTTDTDH